MRLEGKANLTAWSHHLLELGNGNRAIRSSSSSTVGQCSSIGQCTAVAAKNRARTPRSSSKPYGANTPRGQVVDTPEKQRSSPSRRKHSPVQPPDPGPICDADATHAMGL